MAKLPLIGGTNNLISDRNAKDSTHKYFLSQTPTGKHSVILEPVPGRSYSTVINGPISSGTGCHGGIDLGDSAYTGIGSGIVQLNSFVGDVKVANLFTTNDRSSWASSGSGTNKQILITQNGNTYVYSITYATAWPLSTTAAIITGTPSSTAASKLIDNTAPLWNNGAIRLGMTIENTTAGTYAFIEGYTYGSSSLQTITGDGTTTVVVSHTSHPFSTGDYIKVSGYVADADANGEDFVVTYIDANSYSYVAGSTVDVGSGSASIQYVVQLDLSDDIFPNTTDTYTLQRFYGEDFDSDTCTFLDGYFIREDLNNTGRFYVSALFDATRWNALDYATAEQHRDDLVCVQAHQGNLWLIGTKSTEVWYNSGNPDFPFEPIQSGFSNIGTQKKHTVTTVGNYLFAVGSTTGGYQQIVRSEGLQFVPIQNSQIPAALDVRDFAFSYGVRNNLFYCLGRQSLISGYTESQDLLCYNISTDTFHTDDSNLGYLAYTGEIDTVTGELLGYGAFTDSITNIFSITTFGSENDASVSRSRTTTVFHGEGRGLRHHAVEVEIDLTPFHPVINTCNPVAMASYPVEFEALGLPLSGEKVYNITKNQYSGAITGYSGHTVVATGMGAWDKGDLFRIEDTGGDTLWPTDVTLSLRYKDGDKDWSTPKTRDVGVTSTRAVWRSLGRSKERTYELTIDDVMPIKILGAYAIIDNDDREL